MFQDPHNNFIVGNVILAIALIMLLFMGRLWEAMGPAAMGLWIAVALAGAYLLLNSKDPDDTQP